MFGREDFQNGLFFDDKVSAITKAKRSSAEKIEGGISGTFPF